MTPTAGPIGARWDDEHRHGRYEAEPPLPCGNGRNYLSLIDAGARRHGAVGSDLEKAQVSPVYSRASLTFQEGK